MAKQSILDIIIRTIKQGGGDKETVKGLTAIKGSITGAISTFAALAGVAYTVDKVLDATVDVYVKYAQNVRDTSRALGLSADETSRVIAMTDDLGISYDDLSAAIKKNADNTKFSIEGLAQSSIAYLALSDAQDRAKYAQANYGKQWVEFSKLLEKGPEQVRAMAAAIDEGHLFDETDLARVEKYRIELDKINDSWESLKLTLGETFLPPILGLLEKINLEIEEENGQVIQAEKGWRMWLGPIGAVWNLLDLFTNQSPEVVTAMELQGEAVTALDVNYRDLLGSIKNMQSETDRYQETQTEANAAIEQANADLAAGTIDAVERNSIVDENTAKLAENAAAHQLWAAETVFAFAQAKAAADGSITQGEGQVLIDMGVQLGLFDQQTADVMENVNSAFDNVDTENAQQVINALKKQLEELTGHNWQINITTNTSGAGMPSAPPGGSIGRAQGTGGWITVPAGFPSDNYMVGLTSNEMYAVATPSDVRRGAVTNNNSKSIVIQNLTVVAQKSVIDVLEELT